jgi:hypothetical protein
MFALLNPRILIALAIAAALAFTHFSAYRSGKANVRAAWDAEKAQQVLALAAANEENRRIAERRTSLSTEASNAAQKQTQVARADAAASRDAADGLRGDLTAARTQLAGAADAARAKYSAAVDSVLTSCTRRYSEVAEAAQGHAIDSLMYQRAWPK